MASTQPGELQEVQLTISDSARSERLARQVRRMAAHLDMREGAMQHAETRADHLELVTDALYRESWIMRDRLSQAEARATRAETRAKLAEDAYQSVMALKTMRLLRHPRALYARLLHRTQGRRERP